jgi:hypothetical protein
VTSLQIFSGLAPLALGVIGLAMAHSDLMRVRRRKTRKLLPLVEGREKQFHLWSLSVQKPNVLVGYAGIVFVFISVCFLLLALKEPPPTTQSQDKTILKNFTDRFKRLGIGGP